MQQKPGSDKYQLVKGVKSVQDLSNILHVRASVFLYAFNVVCVGLLAVSFLFFTKQVIVGLILTLVTVSLLGIGLLWYLRYNTRFVNSFSGMPMVLEQVISKSNQPITVCKHTVNKLGIVAPKVVFANQAYLALKNNGLKEVIGKDVPYTEEVSDIDRGKILQAFQNGEPVSARIVDKDEQGRLYENELSITPVTIGGKVSYWLGSRNFVQYLDNNVISLGKQQVKVEHPTID